MSKKISALIERLERSDPLSKGDKGKAADALIELRKALLDARKAMMDVVSGEAPSPRHYRPQQCPHGREYYEDCQSCTDETLTEAVQRIEAVLWVES